MTKETASEARLRMVKDQLEARGIHDKTVLSVMSKIPRHLFVPQYDSRLAYLDQALPSWCGQTISQPYIVAKMTELLQLDKSHKVLEIGTGTGYQTVILAELAGEVYTMEIIPELHELTSTNPVISQYTNIHFILGNGYDGYPQAAPFDAIIVTAAPPAIPDALIEQLASPGRMVIPIGRSLQMLLLVNKDEAGNLHENTIFQVVFVPMVN